MHLFAYIYVLYSDYIISFEHMIKQVLIKCVLRNTDTLSNGNIYMSEMKERRSSSLDSREYRNSVTEIKQMPLRLFEIYDHELGLEATISRRT